MKRKLKAFVCSLLAIATVLSGTSIAFAKEDVTPVVCVHGMGATTLYKNIGTENEAPAGSFNAAALFTVYNDLLKKVIASMNGEFIDADNLIDEMAALMQDFTDIACDKNGNSLYDVSIKSYWTDSLANHTDYLDSSASNEPAIAKQIADKIGAENVYAFNYDWRLDACENAEKLNKFIDGVKAQTGKSKVTIVSCSEGTVVACAYIDKYKNKNDIEKSIFVNGALNGVGVAKMFRGDIYIDKDTILGYLWDITHTYNNGDVDLKKLSFLSYTLSDAVDNLCTLLNQIIDSPKLLKRFYNEVLYPVFGCIPILWEFIPYDDFNASVNKMSSIGFLDKSSGLYGKISKYHGVQGRLESNLNALKSKGVEIAIISNYGLPAIPVTSAHSEQTDQLIEAMYSSAGATVADFDKTLDRSGKYVSPDKIIDASTCMLPDNTWFIKGIQHMGFNYGSEATEFIAQLTVTDSPLNIESIKKETGRDQFMGTDSAQNIISVTALSTQSFTPAAASGTQNTTDEKKSPLTGNSNTALCLCISFALTSLVFALTTLRKRKANAE